MVRSLSCSYTASDDEKVRLPRLFAQMRHFVTIAGLALAGLGAYVYFGPAFGNVFAEFASLNMCGIGLMIALRHRLRRAK